MNPLVPSVADVVVAALAVVNLVLVAVALVAVLRSDARGARLPLGLLVGLVPIAGPILALTLLRRHRVPAT